MVWLGSFQEFRCCTPDPDVSEKEDVDDFGKKSSLYTDLSPTKIASLLRTYYTIHLSAHPISRVRRCDNLPQHHTLLRKLFLCLLLMKWRNWCTVTRLS